MYDIMDIIVSKSNPCQFFQGKGLLFMPADRGEKNGKEAEKEKETTKDSVKI